MEYLFTFLEGIASFVSPCILPMLPIYISYFTGKEEQKSKAVVNSIGFVIGFSVIFITLAILANVIGATIIAYMKYVKIFFGIGIIFLGLNYIDVIKLSIFKQRKVNIDTSNLNFIKSVLFGILFSVSMTPCIGTFLSAALLLVASKETLVDGIVLIVLYCIGLGIPFIVSAVLIDKLKSVFTFIKKNFRIIKIISGIILIIMGLYLIFV